MGAEKIEEIFDVGHTSINNILKKNNLTHTNSERTNYFYRTYLKVVTIEKFKYEV
ncbi:MAG: hypothetical protein AABX07_05695 [Nanoarchaeota archaeon]